MNDPGSTTCYSLAMGLLAFVMSATGLALLYLV
jgi:hypothetical protein